MGQPDLHNSDYGDDWTEEERRLVYSIEADIKAHPERYRDAGKRLDELFYDEEAYWKRIACRAGSIEGEAMKAENCLGPADYRELKDLHKRLEAKETPYRIDRFREAMRCIMEGYVSRPFFGVLLARAVCLMTWLATDPDADTVGLGLTQFEQWGWNKEEVCEITTASKVRTCLAGGTARFNLLWQLPLLGMKSKWMEIAWAAWQKVQTSIFTGREVGETARPKDKKPRRRGRKELPEVEKKKRLDVLAKWIRAGGAGISRTQFCEDEGIMIVYLERCQAWQRRRESRDTP